MQVVKLRKTKIRKIKTKIKIRINLEKEDSLEEPNQRKMIQYVIHHTGDPFLLVVRPVVLKSRHLQPSPSST